MKIKSLLLASALAIAGMSVAAAKSAKSYEIVLASPSKVANVQLPAGTYKMKVEGASAVFTNEDNGKSVTAPAKVETGNKKFDLTSVESNSDQIHSIELGGTTTTVEFGGF